MSFYKLIKRTLVNFQRASIVSEKEKRKIKIIQKSQFLESLINRKYIRLALKTVIERWLASVLNLGLKDIQSYLRDKV